MGQNLNSVATRFKKGQVPWNKGLHGHLSEETLKKISDSGKGRPSWAKGKGITTNTGRTWFKKGMISPNKGKKRPNMIGNQNGFKKGHKPWNTGRGDPIRAKENRRLYEVRTKESKSKYDRLYRFRNQERKKENDRLYQIKNRERLKLQRKEYYEKNKEKILKQQQIYMNNHKKEKNAYDRVYRLYKYKTDVNYKLSHALRSRINRALKRSSAKKADRTYKLTDCSINELRKYLENKFKEGMTWENHSFCGWHIDHIKPCSSFNLTIPEEQYKCFHYTNLQPLWAEENMSKGDKYNG